MMIKIITQQICNYNIEHMKMKYLLLVVIITLVEKCLTINFVLSKSKIYIGSDSQYISNIQVRRENADLIPINMSVQTTIANSVPSYSSYFDYFYFLTPQQVSCYQQAVNNQSYLFPCPFVNSKNALRRASYVKSQRFNQSVDEIKNLSFSFIVDNTLFPYPSGAYGYAPITIDVSLQVIFTVSSSYQVLGTRLIFITATVFFIFLVIMLILICKTRSLNKQMQSSNLTQNQREHLESVMNNENSDSSSTDEEQELSARQLRQKFLEDNDSMVEEVGKDPMLRRSNKTMSQRQHYL